MIINLRQLLIICVVILTTQVSQAQLGFSHEVGVITGPVQFRSDFGQRFNEENNIGNTGYGIGLIHYINFSYRADCNCYTSDTYFNDHFKLRSEISYNKTKLDHFGRWVDGSQFGIDGQRLRAHSGEANNFDIGMQLEYFPLSIRAFSSHTGGWAPFISLGAHYTMSSPKQFTTFGRDGGPSDNNIFNPDNIYGPWIAASGGEYPINVDPINAWSVVSSIGTRYKLTILSDLMIDLRFQYYFSDWIDGLNHKLPSNKFNDVLIWLNFGYIYYLD
ncbi:THC0290_0291 family protein [Winogradskyella haliclonae]|uniref:Glutamate dehydrogenase n=1 Tax=Winogradskyella haliclonae TaxID=2048558 RepID=A0ABQ2BWL3_9FLAO|nr:glutamate dehydrogenase [Winogradskyella haliclonae]GGI56469.1 glutamate dehydrogenase [Winogradskyella haliclonae]